MKQLFTEQDLESLGFKFMGKSPLDDGYYIWWKLKISGICICYTIEYSSEDIIMLEYFEIGEKIIYANKITKEEMWLVIAILKR